MNRACLTGFCIAVVYAVSACSTYHAVYRTARISTAQPDGSVFMVGFHFVRVEGDSTAVVRCWNPLLHRSQEYRAKRGEYFHDAHGNIGIRLVSASPQRQEITVKYLYKTDRGTL